MLGPESGMVSLATNEQPNFDRPRVKAMVPRADSIDSDPGTDMSKVPMFALGL